MIAFALYGATAVLCAVMALVVLRTGGAARADRRATGLALAVTALWSGAVAALGADTTLAWSLEVARNLAWIFALFRHFANDGRADRLRLVRQVVAALMMAEGLHFVLLASSWGSGQIETSALLGMLVAVGSLFLVHNLVVGASPSSRRLMAWNSGGLALFWLFELNLDTIAYLTGSAVFGLDILRALVVAAVAVAFGIGAARGSSGLTFRPSRTVAFSTLSLGVLAVYFIAMVWLAGGAARMAGELARLTQVGFLLLAATAALVWLPSPRLRGTARVLALKHLFKHRYDYREEWLRFTGTLASAKESGAGLHERAVQSLADITDSPAGLLLMPTPDGDLALGAQWRWPDAEVPPRALPQALVRLLERHMLIIDLDEVRGGIDRFGEAELIPAWLREEPGAWAGVPLLHQDRLVGFAVLSRPQIARRLDWEDFDLLAIAGRQVASYLAEYASQEALQDAARFDEFNRRMAFVMHDIKNLSSQLGLLARNAERHAENPEFRKDMLLTLRNSADKLDALVARLGRYGSRAAPAAETVDLGALARTLATRAGPGRQLEILGEAHCAVLGNEEMLEQALTHLVQNAFDASAPGVPVMVEVATNGLRGTIAIVDAGHGMSAQFMRSDLFRPFVSTKEGGFGIGVCEAREHARAMGGRLEVESREGVGSRFTISLPLAEASRLIAGRASGRLPAIPTDEKAA